MVMHMKYRKPITNIRDRHVLIELDGDFTHDEMRHILNHAYLSHKAPHDYDDAKKYIRDLVIGEHNSVYIMYNGSPEPLASASVLYPDQLSVLASGKGINYDFMIVLANMNCGSAGVGIGYTNNGTCTSVGVNSPSGSSISGVVPTSLPTYGYNNGTALTWELLYANTNFTSISPVEAYNSPTPPSAPLAVGPYNPVMNTFYGQMVPYSGIKYGYAPYLTSNNPLTLSTYYYWEAPSVSFSYVYFNLYANANAVFSGNGITSSCYTNVLLVPIFYSQGNYSFNANTYYISMWQWTYT